MEEKEMIITVSREFGSGGRELGKRLADVLAIPYYDKAIVTLLAQEHGFDESYVAHMTEKNPDSLSAYYWAAVYNIIWLYDQAVCPDFGRAAKDYWAFS